MGEETGIVELLERTKDDNATFTAQEVRRIMEFVNESAINDIYNKARIAEIMQQSHARVQREKTMLQALINSMGNGSSPQLISLVDDLYE